MLDAGVFAGHGIILHDHGGLAWCEWEECHHKEVGRVYDVQRVKPHPFLSPYVVRSLQR